MAILKIHQSRSSDHDRLGFHPDCPVCRQDRLFGVLSPEPIWSRRLRALLAAGVLAVSAGTTTTSVASEPDDQQEGVVLPAPGGPPPVGDGPGHGSGSETALPFEVDPVVTAPEDDPTDGQPDDAAPLEAAPVDDPDGGLALTAPNAPEDDASAVDPDEVDASDTPAPPAEPLPPGTSDPPTPPSGDTGDQPASAEQAPAAKPEQRSRVHRKRHAARKRARQHSRDELRAPDPPAVYTPSTDTAALANDTQPATSAAVAPAPPRIRGRFHVVLPGESLWSIASALLDADASSATVALEVRRVWRLNEARIGTGDPNLLPVGVRLRLR